MRSLAGGKGGLGFREKGKGEASIMAEGGCPRQALMCDIMDPVQHEVDEVWCMWNTGTVARRVHV